MKNDSVILSLDMSTSCTGWALFDVPSKKLLKYGTLKAKVPGKSKLSKLDRTLQTMLCLADDIRVLVHEHNPVKIVIEEITGSKNRLGQKTLDGFHWIVLYTLRPYLDRVVYYDVGGEAGWRSKDLQLRLSEADKAANKEARTLNKKLAVSQEIPVIGPKHLSVRYVNRKFGMVLDFDRNRTDGDIADAVAMGDAFVTFHCANLKI